MATYFCNTCNEIFVIPTQRGRPPTKCSTCKAKETPPVVVSVQKIVTAGISHSAINDNKMMSLFCHACNEVFAFPARRGRPPKYCSNCIASGAATSYEEQKLMSLIAKAKTRVDNLELMLRSRGNHISQNRHKWE